MKKNNPLFLILCFVVLFFIACEDKKQPPATDITQKKSTVTAPAFNEDSAYYFIEKQVSFGPRIPNTISHVKCSDYLVQTLKKQNAIVTEQDMQVKAFDGTILRAKNIIASFNPNATKRILLAAHWDTRPWSDEDEKSPNKTFDGANDGASGVGVLLEIARVIQQSELKPKVGVDIILFDAEDYGKSEHKDSYCLGSQYWSKNKHEQNYSAYYGILLDMVGAKDAKFCKEGVSMEYAPSVVNKIWDYATTLGYGNYFISQNAGSITDDHFYVNKIAKIPMVDIIDYRPNSGFGEFWHTQNDNIQIIDKATLKAVGQTVLHVLYNE